MEQERPIISAGVVGEREGKKERKWSAGLRRLFK
jgi:hypothetical protein